MRFKAERRVETMRERSVRRIVWVLVGALWGLNEEVVGDWSSEVCGDGRSGAGVVME